MAQQRLHPHGQIHTRCAQGHAQTLISPPLIRTHTGQITPFPAMFWLVCPSLCARAGRLESEGFLQQLRAAAQRTALAQAINAYTQTLRAYRQHNIPAALLQAYADRPRYRQALETSGVGGSYQPLRPVCLHALLAAHLGFAPHPLVLYAQTLLPELLCCP